MADYGSHPTSLGSLSNDALFSMYRTDTWSKLNEASRLELLQETANRSAKLNGELGSCQVIFDQLPSNIAGAQGGDIIRMNRDMFVNEKLISEYNGKLYEQPVRFPSFQALETLLHEDIHAWQNQCIDGTIACPDQALLKEYTANGFDLAVVSLPDGTVNVGQQYLSGVSTNGGEYLYYLQSTERDAHRYSEQRTKQIAERLTEKYGNDPAVQAYLNNLSVNGFDAVLADAKNYFGSEFVEQDINITLMNAFYGTNEPVHSPQVANSVKAEMVLSLEESMRSSIVQDPAMEAAPAPSEPAPSIENTGPDEGMDL